MNKQQSKRILIDMDGILCDLLTPWLELYNTDHGDSISISNIKTFELWRETKIGKEMDDYLLRPGLYRNLQPLAGAKEGVKALHDLGLEIFICTSMGTNPNCIPEKSLWLDEHLPYIDHRHRIYTGAKHCCYGRYLIDDSPAKAREWKLDNPHGKALAIEYPYNIDEASYSMLAKDYSDTELAWKMLVSYVNQDQAAISNPYGNGGW